MDFVKMSALVGETFTVKAVDRFIFKKWDTGENKMLTSERYQEGYSKKYPVQTDKGQLDMSGGQIGQLLEAIVYQGKADINGRAFKVGSNGKTGMEIRYYFNAMPKGMDEATQPDQEDEVDASDLPF